ncbi:hypothetical protein D9615_000737 [Tricholomella constricta]|uniref:Uncharacterized protein n=1 Tax=Tricholomella constricta TaxID=117010 RepID=A0A8H5HQK9_9AGAR|nr:hypothetical protein D9615_000737 [Tricholomella constricta]
MPIQIPASLVRCILSIHKFFYNMVSPPPSSDLAPVDKFLFPLSCHIPTWTAHMRSNESRFGELMTGAFVRKLYFVKSSSSVQHEHIVAEIHNRTSVDPPVRYLRLERVGGNTKLEDIRLREQQKRDREEEQRRQLDSSLQPVADAASESSHRSKGHYDAVDAVKALPESWDLAIAAQVAHEEDEQYKLLEHQCYWWADTLIAIFESTVDEKYRTKTVGGHEERTNDRQAKETDTRSGKLQYIWIDFPIYTRPEVSHLNSRFEAYKAPFVEARLENTRLKAQAALSETFEREAKTFKAQAETSQAEADFFKAEAGRSAEELKAERDARLNLQAQFAKLMEERDALLIQSGLPLTSAA